MSDTNIKLSGTDINQLQEQLAEALKKVGQSSAQINANGGTLTQGMSRGGKTLAMASAVTAVSSLTSTATGKSLDFFAAGKYRKNDGKLVYGIRMENTEPGHNKEYTISVTKRPLAGASPRSAADEYFVEAAWGPIGNIYKVETKDIDGKQSTSNKTRAIEAAKDLERSKKAKGYVEQFRHEDDTGDDVEDYVDWNLTDDLIVNVDLETKEVAEIKRDCDCFLAVEELGQFAYAEPIVAGLEVAPLLTAGGYGLVRFPDHKRGARWLVTVISGCQPYLHARAIAVGDAFDDAKLGDRKRSTPQYIEDLIRDSVEDKSSTNDAIEFTILVEERGIDLAVIDAYRWDGEDLIDAPWSKRRQKLDSTFAGRFQPRRKGGRNVDLAPRFVSRLRETYLAEGDKARFELYPADSVPGSVPWQLPKL